MSFLFCTCVAVLERINLIVTDSGPQDASATSTRQTPARMLHQETSTAPENEQPLDGTGDAFLGTEALLPQMTLKGK